MNVIEDVCDFTFYKTGWQYLSQFLHIHHFPAFSHMYCQHTIRVLCLNHLTWPSFLLFSLLRRALIRTAWGIRVWVRAGGRRGGGRGGRAGAVLAVTATVFRRGWRAGGVAAVWGRVAGRARRITAAGAGGGPQRKQHVNIFPQCNYTLTLHNYALYKVHISYNMFILVTWAFPVRQWLTFFS